MFAKFLRMFFPNCIQEEKPKKKKKSALWGYVAKAVVVLGIINGSREILTIFL